jgi:hypothetical protein
MRKTGSPCARAVMTIRRWRKTGISSISINSSTHYKKRILSWTLVLLYSNDLFCN